MPKIKGFRQLHGDFGWRTISFLGIDTDVGTTGWTEYYEGAGNLGLNALIAAHLDRMVGEDAMALERILTRLRGATLQAPGGLNAQAIGSIGNALLDIRGKEFGVPVHALWGGAIRERVPVYWSHFGSYRVRYPQFLELPAPKTLDDLSRLAADAATSGLPAIKTTALRPVEGGFSNYRPTTGESSGYPALRLDAEVAEGIANVLAALKAGAGPHMGVALDINFFFKPAGFRELARRLEPLGLFWLEVDSAEAEELGRLRRDTRIPVASLEHLYGRQEYRRFLDAGAVDVAIVDPIWNGFAEAVRIAALAEAYEVNVAPHNYYGYLSDFINANLAAMIPNLAVMETDLDAVPWRHEFYTHAPEIAGGEMTVPDVPGWGTEIDVEAVARRPSAIGKAIAER
jgi:L-alanine-DL-glutamate epimerase-like enolase superfamily enzyme